MKIRDARADDAAAACEVMRRSITELCVADHRNDATILARWLANKTPEIVGGWITNPGGSILVAVAGERILGVGGVTDKGEITLNYVAPEARFQGVSRALLAALETRAAERGNARCTLVSTETAHRLYLAAGYADDGEPQGKFGTDASYPMAKEVSPRPLILETQRLRLRPHCEGDGAALYQAVSESLDELRRYPASLRWAMEQQSASISEAFCRDAIRRLAQKEEFAFLFCLKDSSAIIGSGGLLPRDSARTRFEIGWWGRTPYMGQGLMTEGIGALIAFAFSTLKATRLEALPDDENSRSCRMCERLGFTLETVLRAERLDHAGRPRDTRVYSLRR